MPRQITTSQFITRAKEKFPQLDFSNTKYIGSKSPIKVRCSKHGEVSIPTADFFLRSKYGCGQCGREKRLENSKKSKGIGKDEFLRRVKIIWSNKYDFSKAVWVNRSTKVIVKCNQHNYEWKPRPDGLMGQTGRPGPAKGCPICFKERRQKKL